MLRPSSARLVAAVSFSAASLYTSVFMEAAAAGAMGASGAGAGAGAGTGAGSPGALGAQGATTAGEAHGHHPRHTALHACRPLVLCGPSGAGKSTLIKRLEQEFPNDFGFSVSHTSRKPRPGEVDGVHYHFTSPDVIRDGATRGEFLETANVHGNWYGTSRAAVDTVGAQNKICVLDIDVQGVKSCQSVKLDALYVFIQPPSVEELERRLRGRGTETAKSLETRLRNAVAEIDASHTLKFDLRILNDDVETAYQELRSALVPAIRTCASCRQTHPDEDGVCAISPADAQATKTQ